MLKKECAGGANKWNNVLISTRYAPSPACLHLVRPKALLKRCPHHISAGCELASPQPSPPCPARAAASGERARRGACQLPGRRATLAAAAPGFAVLSIPTVGTAAAGSPCSTARANCSPVGAVTAWLMPASRRRPCTAVSIGRKRSGCASAAVPFPKRPRGMHRGTDIGFGRAPFCTIRSQVTLKWLSPLKLRHLPAAR